MGQIEPKVEVKYAENAVIVTFTKRKILEEHEIQSLQEAIMSVIEGKGRINLVLDFRNVQFLSSAVLGLLIRISKKIYEYNSQLRLCNIDPKVYEIFKITRLTKIFDIHRDLESAIGSLSEPG